MDINPCRSRTKRIQEQISSIKERNASEIDFTNVPEPKKKKVDIADEMVEFMKQYENK